MRNLIVFLIVATAMTLGGCASNPVSGNKDFVMMSEQQEIALGCSSDAEVRKQYKVYANPALQSYVNRVGQEVAAHSHRPNIHYTQYHHRAEGRYLRQTGATLAVR